MGHEDSVSQRLSDGSGPLLPDTMFLGDLSWLELPMLAGRNGEESILPCLLLVSKFVLASPLLLHSIFYSKLSQKIQLLIAAFVFKIRREKIPAPKHGDFDLDTYQNSLGSTESPIVPVFFSAASLSLKVLPWPPTASSGVV